MYGYIVSMYNKAKKNQSNFGIFHLNVYCAISWKSWICQKFEVLTIVSEYIYFNIDILTVWLHVSLTDMFNFFSAPLSLRYQGFTVPIFISLKILKHTALLSLFQASTLFHYWDLRTTPPSHSLAPPGPRRVPGVGSMYRPCPGVPEIHWWPSKHVQDRWPHLK